eukprot:TRINITY_DN61549_c0_g1_i1.p1 TRINITY_DN61549_c0_g1~~TRINITY_DN61549_c0_g1_i1.p1  ORF type:complete len:303 (-),score=43.05 TRINITY_DN61549_c0_g1_i1:119-940(-)
MSVGAVSAAVNAYSFNSQKVDLLDPAAPRLKILVQGRKYDREEEVAIPLRFKPGNEGVATFRPGAIHKWLSSQLRANVSSVYAVSKDSKTNDYVLGIVDEACEFFPFKPGSIVVVCTDGRALDARVWETLKHKGSGWTQFLEAFGLDWLVGTPGDVRSNAVRDATARRQAQRRASDPGLGASARVAMHSSGVRPGEDRIRRTSLPALPTADAIAASKMQTFCCSPTIPEEAGMTIRTPGRGSSSLDSVHFGFEDGELLFDKDSFRPVCTQSPR